MQSRRFFGLTVVKVILVIAFLAIVLYVYIFFKSLNKKEKRLKKGANQGVILVWDLMI